MNSPAPQNKPVKEIPIGRIRAKIWANDAPDREVWFNVTVVRSYNVGNVWKESTSFGRDDLPIVSLVVNMAYEWIWDRQASADQLNRK
jgi:hypothetical protein